MKSISVLGSTGSIGVNTLNIVKEHPKKFKVRALAARSNAKRLLEQAKEFRPDVVCLFEERDVAKLEKSLKKYKIKVVTGIQGLLEVASLKQVDTVVFAVVGAIGLLPLFEAVRAGKDVAVANKEPLVMAGQLLMKEAKKNKVAVLPIDSEHSGLWQCLEGYDQRTVRKLVLTSSGGPFRNYKGSLAKVRPAQALKHPKWKMGRKITIDSATLMNKGLEVIEAANLFDVPAKQIDVLVHPEAIVHALIEFNDGSVLANLAQTDMKLPIQYALSYPERYPLELKRLDLAELKTLSFEKPQRRKFPCLDLGYEASRLGGTMPSVLNAANEIAVQAFLEGKISFTGIAKLLEKVMTHHQRIQSPKLDEILAVDAWARQEADGIVNKKSLKLKSSKSKVV